jgi:hypothetical protein
MNHWLCASCRATHRDSILRFDVDEKDLRRVLRALLTYHRLPMWKKIYAAPIYAIADRLAGWMLGKSLRMSEDCAYVDVAEGRDSSPYYVPFPDTLSPRHRKIWAYTYVNGLLRYN